MDTTDRLTDIAIVAARRINVAIVEEVQGVREDADRRSIPIVAVVADTAETATVAVTRSRIPDSLI